MVPSAKQQGIAIQFTILIGFVGNVLTATLSAAREMNRFDQFFRLILKILSEQMLWLTQNRVKACARTTD